MSQDWWIDFFNGDDADCVLTVDTEDSVHFVQTLCDISKNTVLLDQCCGKGHLSYGLSQLGLNVIGVDASAYYIQFANQHFSSASCHFIQTDARELILERPVDIAINWHTSLAYCEEDIDNMRLFQGLANNLIPGGKFIIVTMNPGYILANFQKFIVRYLDFTEGQIIAIRESYLESKMLKSKWLFVHPTGKRVEKWGQTKLYSLSDFTQMLSSCHLLIESVFGDLDFRGFHEASPNMILVGKKL